MTMQMEEGNLSAVMEASSVPDAPAVKRRNNVSHHGMIVRPRAGKGGVPLAQRPLDEIPDLINPMKINDGHYAEDDAAIKYMQRMRRLKTLSPEQETELGQRMEHGRRMALAAFLEVPAVTFFMRDKYSQIADGVKRSIAFIEIDNFGEPTDDDDSASTFTLGHEDASAAAREKSRIALEALEDGTLEPATLLETIYAVRPRDLVMEDMAAHVPTPEYAEQAKRIRTGLGELRRATHNMTEANLPRVVGLARQFAARGVAMSDLIQEGSIGLMRAVERYDARFGKPFGGIAYMWIVQALQEATTQGRTIRLPLRLAMKLHELRMFRHEFMQTSRRPPTYAEAAAHMGVKADVIATWISTPVAVASLDAPVSDDNDSETTLGQVIEDKGARSALDILIDADTQKQVTGLLETLPPKEADILRRRFGLGGAAEDTLAEVGDRYSISRERVRQIERKGMERLRTPDVHRLLEADADINRPSEGAGFTSAKKIAGRLSLLLNEHAAFAHVPELVAALAAKKIFTIREVRKAMAAEGLSEQGVSAALATFKKDAIVGARGALIKSAHILAKIADVTMMEAYPRHMPAQRPASVRRASYAHADIK